MCANTIPRRKTIHSDPREAVTAANQSGKHYEAISKQSEVHHSTVRKLFISEKHSRQLLIFPGVDSAVNSPQRNWKKEKKKIYISDATGLSQYVKS